MADWTAIHQYAHTGTTTGFLGANAGMGTQTLQQAAQAYPQVPVLQHAAARRQQAGRQRPATTSTMVQRGATTGPLQTPPPQPYTPNPANARPAPNLLPDPDEGPGPAKTFMKHLKALDDRAAVIPTPGDLGPWLLALAFLLSAVVSFNGYTRLQLIWYSLTGAAGVPGIPATVARGVAGISRGNGAGSGTGGNVAQSNNAGGSGTPPPPKQEAPGGFTPRAVAGGGL